MKSKTRRKIDLCGCWRITTDNIHDVELKHECFKYNTPHIMHKCQCEYEWEHKH